MASENVTSELESAPLSYQQMIRNTHTGQKIVHCDILDHYCDVIMCVMESQITSLTIVYSTIHSGTDQRKYQSSASLAFVWIIHGWPMNSPHKGPVTRKMFPFDDVIMFYIGAFVQQVYWRWSSTASGDGSVQDRRHVVPPPTVICCELGCIDSRQLIWTWQKSLMYK